MEVGRLPDRQNRKRYIHKIPLPHLSDRYKKIPMDKKVVVVGHKSKQAPLAVRYLRHMGYTNVCMLKGGGISVEEHPFTLPGR